MHFSILTRDEVEAIHRASLNILDQAGLILTHPEGREMLHGLGARMRGQRVFLPPATVERALEHLPQQVSIRGRDGKTAVLGDGSLHWHNLGGAREIYEPSSGKRRPATIADVRQSAQLLDSLENATTVTPFYTPQDVPGSLMSLMMYRHTVPHTVKPIHGPGVQSAQEVAFIARMAEVIGPPAEVISLGISPISPLTFPDDIVAAIIETARQGIALGPLPCPTAGATAPISLAGALAQQNAEVLASIVLAQAVALGSPVYYCGRLAMLDPRSGSSVWGGVELGLVSAGTVQIGHHYGLPVNVYGLSTNAPTLDVQNGYERALNAAIPALAGADELSGIGEMEAGVMGSFAQMVIDDEIAASVRRLRRGVRVDEDALGVELIARVMDTTGNFLSEEHTVRYLRAGELLVTRLAERLPWDEWERSGRENMVERAQAEAERLLAQHQVPPLTPDQERELDGIMAQAEREIKS